MDGLVVVVLVLWVAQTVVCLLAGGIIGQAKGYPSAGYFLGFVFGFIGVIIIALLPPSLDWTAQAKAERDSRHQQLLDAIRSVAHSSSTPPSEPARTPRAGLIAEAMRRDPTVDSDDEPETLMRLAQSVAALEREYEMRSELMAFRAQRKSHALQGTKVATTNGHTRLADASQQVAVGESAPGESEPGDGWALFNATDEQEAVALAQDPATPAWALRRYMWSGKFDAAKAVIQQRLDMQG